MTARLEAQLSEAQWQMVSSTQHTDEGHACPHLSNKIRVKASLNLKHAL